MTPLDIVLADIATLEAARNALPPYSHVAALLSLTPVSFAGRGRRPTSRGPQEGGGVVNTASVPLGIHFRQAVRTDAAAIRRGAAI